MSETSMTSTADLIFNPETLSLTHSAGKSVSLDLKLTRIPAELWAALEIADDTLASVDLDDLPCRLSPEALLDFLPRVQRACRDGAELKLRLPNPRHNVFYSDLGYVRALLPAAFESPRLGLTFEMKETLVELDPAWQDKMERENIPQEEIEAIASQAANVIAYFHSEFTVRKTEWMQTSDPVLTPEIRFQLQQQLMLQAERGNTGAAETIRKFLAQSPAHMVNTVPPEIDKLRNAET